MKNALKPLILLLLLLLLFSYSLQAIYAKSENDIHNVAVEHQFMQDRRDYNSVSQPLQIKNTSTISDPYLNIEPIQTQTYPGQTIEVNVTIHNATDLYGLQVNCAVDPNVLAWQTTIVGSFFTDPLVGSVTGDIATGTWSTAVTQKNPAPALSGSGSFATFTFEAVAPGTTPVTCEPLASDRDGFELPISAISTTVTVSEPLGVIDGTIKYQGRTEHSGIAVTATNSLSTTVQTDNTGQFEISELQNGNYTVQADANLYLPSCTEVIIDNGQVTASLPLLAGGDIDDNDEIRINDAALIGSNLGLSNTTTPVMDPRADINGDGQVNVQDLSMLGGNFGKAGCQTSSST